MTLIGTFCLQALSPLDLHVSERDKHERLLSRLRTAPHPWTPIGEFGPLRKPGAQAVSTLEVLSKKIFPKWVKEVMVDYIPRTPGAAGRGRRSKDSITVVIDMALAPEGTWIDDLLQVIFSGFGPSVIRGYNQESLRRRGRENEEIQRQTGAWPISFKKLNHEYSIDEITEVLFVARAACQECLGQSPEGLISTLVERGENASLLADGMLLLGADRYLTADEAYAVQDRLTRIFREVVPEGMKT